MRYTSGTILCGLFAVAVLASPTRAETPTGAELKANLFGAPTGEEGGSALDCPRPEAAREAKVIDFDPASSTARLAVNVGSGRFTLVTIKTWDRPQDPRPLVPVIEAARIMQGKLQFFSRKLSADPASAPDEYLIMTEMGGGFVCWAKPSWMMQPASAPTAGTPDAKAAPVIPAAVVTPPTTTTTPVEQPAPEARPSRRRPATWIRDGVVVRDAASQ